MIEIQHMGTGCRIHDDVVIEHPDKLVIGDNVHIHRGAFIDAVGSVTIGDNTHIAPNVMIYSSSHNWRGEALPYDAKKICKPVVIGRNVWLCDSVKIVPGITIGDGAVVGLGVVVARDVPPLAIVVVPDFKIIEYRDKDKYNDLDNSGQYGGVGGSSFTGDKA